MGIQGKLARATRDVIGADALLLDQLRIGYPAAYRPDASKPAILRGQLFSGEIDLI